jgi:septal ring factor EnvC (AmiA/AmiB activator)
MFARIKIYIIMFSAFAMFAGVAYWYYKDTQAALQIYAQNQAKLETSLTIQRQATASIRRDIVLVNSTMQSLNADLAASRETVSKLQDTFNQNSSGNERDFGNIAESKPALVQRIVNKATQTANRCIELLSGSVPTDEEKTDEKFIDCITTD